MTFFGSLSLPLSFSLVFFYLTFFLSVSLSLLLLSISLSFFYPARQLLFSIYFVFFLPLFLCFFIVGYSATLPTRIYFQKWHVYVSQMGFEPVTFGTNCVWTLLTTKTTQPPRLDLFILCLFVLNITFFISSSVSITLLLFLSLSFNYPLQRYSNLL